MNGSVQDVRLVTFTTSREGGSQCLRGLDASTPNIQAAV